MARRFQRTNFLYPLDLRTNTIDPVATSTDTFERASQGAVLGRPESPFPVPRPAETNGFLQLASALESVNPVITEYLTKQQELTQKQQEAEGRLIFQRRGQSTKSWKKLINETRKTEGEEAARELANLNPNVINGYQESYARQISLDYQDRLQRDYTSNVEVVLDDRIVRLKDIQPGTGDWYKYLSQVKEEFLSAAEQEELDKAYIGEIILPFMDSVDTELTATQFSRASSAEVNKLFAQTYATVDSILNTFASDSRFLGTTSKEELVELLVEKSGLITDELDSVVSYVSPGDERVKSLYTDLVRRIISQAETLAEQDNPVAARYLLMLANNIRQGPGIIEKKIQQVTLEDGTTLTEEVVIEDNFESRPTISETDPNIRRIIMDAGANLIRIGNSAKIQAAQLEDIERRDKTRDVANAIALLYENRNLSPQQRQQAIQQLVNDPQNADIAADILSMRNAAEEFRRQEEERESSEIRSKFLVDVILNNIPAAQARLQASTIPGLTPEDVLFVTKFADDEWTSQQSNFKDELTRSINESINALAADQGFLIRPDGTSLSFSNAITQLTGFSASFLQNQDETYKQQIWSQLSSSGIQLANGSNKTFQNVLGFSPTAAEFSMWIDAAVEAENSGNNFVSQTAARDLKANALFYGMQAYDQAVSLGQLNPSDLSQLGAFKDNFVSNYINQNRANFIRSKGSFGEQYTNPFQRDAFNSSNQLFDAVYGAVTARDWSTKPIFTKTELQEIMQDVIDNDGRAPNSLTQLAAELKMTPFEALLEQAKMLGEGLSPEQERVLKNSLIAPMLFSPENLLPTPRTQQPPVRSGATLPPPPPLQF